MIDEALEHLVKGIVDNPDDVIISEKNHRRGTTLEVRVNPEDIGKVEPSSMPDKFLMKFDEKPKVLRML